ncbi:sensor histidine kinase [Mangrovimonas sp. TPBH4]|uniref:tetratricopeptide repeat-containing sensor histidine kinase n=1 Tax=Mangrovimonas sp. TPBH4 TaxID=1645914 RepID=UPI0006B690B3|nr:sensor histidine kinase [Mangrovimonas sp. TPBH4]
MSQDEEFSLEERLDYALKSSLLAKQMGVDSTILASDRKLSLMYFETEQYDDYVKINQRNVKLAAKLSDTSALAVASSNLGYFYHYVKQVDSAYYYLYKSLDYAVSLSDKHMQADVLTNIAEIQVMEKDYMSGEENAIKAIKLFEKQPKSEYNLGNQWMLTNLLGVISNKLQHYDKAIVHYDQAINIADRMKDGFVERCISINNKAFVYRGKDDFETALDLYEGLLPFKKEYEEYDPSFYALIVDNIAYTKLEAGHTDYGAMDEMFKEAYRISDSLEDPATKQAVCLDISKFYAKLEQRDSALVYAYEARKLSKETSSNEIYLDALMVLSQLKEGDSGKAYLNEHIKLSDSLLNVERNVRNKFARIEFETDLIEQENQRISRERFWLFVLSLVLLFTLFLLYVIATQRAKNKELRFRQDQQKANEEIYNLMLSQQDKVEEARAHEKKRISEELHDGILGRLFGTRLSLDSLSFSEGKEAATSRIGYISELKKIEEDIRKISHDLNTDFVSGSGFMDIVSELVEKQANAYQLNYTFDYTDDINWENVPNKTKINIYRIIQESLQNIYKHAEAQLVKIDVSLKEEIIVMTLTDDGKGFDVNKSRKGIGLKNINSRVAEVDGKLSIDSAPNQGTTITIEIPYIN